MAKLGFWLGRSFFSKHKDIVMDYLIPETTPNYAEAKKFLDLIAGRPGARFMFRVIAERSA